MLAYVPLLGLSPLRLLAAAGDRLEVRGSAVSARKCGGAHHLSDECRWAWLRRLTVLNCLRIPFIRPPALVAVLGEHKRRVGVDKKRTTV